jgi:predicted HAD superfamily phosphohydrolase YqeG
MIPSGCAPALSKKVAVLAETEAGYQRRRFGDLTLALDWADRLSVRTVIIDVEPLIAPWKSGSKELRAGVDAVMDVVGKMKTVHVVAFATNSTREFSMDPARHTGAIYWHSARKPFAIHRYALLPSPGIVIGDQYLTDGILALRLGFAFAEVLPEHPAPPLGPAVLRLAGRIVSSGDSFWRPKSGQA